MLAEIAFNYELLGPKNNKDRDYVVELCSSNDKTIPMLVELVPALNPDSPRYLVRIPLILISTTVGHRVDYDMGTFLHYKYIPRWGYFF